MKQTKGFGKYVTEVDARQIKPVGATPASTTGNFDTPEDTSTGLEAMPEDSLKSNNFDFGSNGDDLSDNIEEDVPF